MSQIKNLNPAFAEKIQRFIGKLDKVEDSFISHHVAYSNDTRESVDIDVRFNTDNELTMSLVFTKSPTRSISIHSGLCFTALNDFIRDALKGSRTEHTGLPYRTAQAFVNCSSFA